MLYIINTIFKDFSFFLKFFTKLFNMSNFKNSPSESKLYSNYGKKNIRNFYVHNIFDKKSFKEVDILWAKVFANKYLLKNKLNSKPRAYFRVLSTKQGFYFNFNKLSKNFNLNFMLINTFLSGFKYIWLGVRFWLIPIIVLTSVAYFTLVLRALPFNKVMFGWICILMFVYWIISGFVFFFKKYQFGKYTTSIQRFWRRTYILFWMIEGGTFLVFLFFTLNSSQESFYMYDQINVFKTHLYSWKYFLLKVFPIVVLIVSTYLLILNLKWGFFSKHTFMLLVLTFLLSYMVWLEFYQFFHVVNFYSNLNWIYDIDDHSWSLELEPRRTRMVNHYVMLLFILKFWHIIFIYGFWVFSLLRWLETKRIRLPLLSANFQNFIILYIFAWVFMYPWFKYYFRRFLDIPYYWFYINNRKIFVRVFFNDLKLIYYGLICYKNNLNSSWLFYFNKSPFFYWKNLENSNNFESYRKHVIKDRIINRLVII